EDSEFDFSDLDATYVSFSYSEITEDEEEKLKVSDVRDQKCSDLEETFKDELGGLGDDFEYDFEIKKASINDLKGCRVEMGFEIFGIKSTQVMYVLVADGDDENGFSVQISTTD